MLYTVSRICRTANLGSNSLPDGVRNSISDIETPDGSFSELNFGPYAQVVDMLDKSFNDAFCEPSNKGLSDGLYVNGKIFERAMRTIDDLMDMLEESDLIRGYLTRLWRDEVIPPDDGTWRWKKDVSSMIMQQLTMVMQFQFLINDALSDLRRGIQLDFEEKYAVFLEQEFTQVIALGENLTTQYRFSVIIEYYCFLMMHFLADRPNVAWCECCGKYFIPKTKRKTLYCDRVLIRGKTCKEIAPSLKHKRDVLHNEILAAFDRAKQRMYKRYEREFDSPHELPKGLTYNEYYEWLDAATDAWDKYVRGEITAEEALKIIDK